MKSSDLPLLLAVKDVARILGVSVGMVRKMMKNGPSVPGGLDIREAHPFRVGVEWRFDREKFMNLLKGGKKNENN